MKRIFLFVLDSFGIGAMPDSESFGDVGVNTLAACATSKELNIPNMIAAGLRSIDRVSVVISDKLKSPVRCRFEHDKIYLSAKTGNGEAKDVCPVAGDGEGLEIGFNNRYLMEALRYAPAVTVKIELNTGVTPAIIVPTEGEENFL